MAGSVNGLQIYNNTFVTNHGVINSPANAYSGSGARTFFNNVIYSTTANAAGKLESLDSDNNVWYYTGGLGLTTRRTAFTQTPNSSPHPHGKRRPGQCVHASCDSPAIDAGRSIAGAGGRDYAGNPVPRGNATDIGAYESGFSRNLSDCLATATLKPVDGRLERRLDHYQRAAFRHLRCFPPGPECRCLQDGHGPRTEHYVQVQRMGQSGAREPGVLVCQEPRAVGGAFFRGHLEYLYAAERDFHHGGRRYKRGAGLLARRRCR